MTIDPEGAGLFHVGRERKTDRRTDIHDEANSRFSQLCECAQKLVGHAWIRGF